LVIPQGCYSLTVSAWGAGGGSAWASSRNSTGGAGGFAQSTLDVIPGESLTAVVGHGGTNAGSTTPSSDLAEGADGCGGSGNSDDGFAGPGGGMFGGDGGGNDGGKGGGALGANPDVESQTGDDDEAHAGAGGAGYSGGEAANDYGDGGGGGSSFGDSTIAGFGRIPGNAAGAGDSGWGALYTANYIGAGPMNDNGTDGRMRIRCYAATTRTITYDPLDPNPHP